MYLQSDFVLKCLVVLRENRFGAVESTGKSTMERVSAIRHFTALLLELSRTKSTKLNLAPDQEENRKHFIVTVKNIVGIGDQNYTNDFIHYRDTPKDFGVSSNFLTTILNSRNDYPGRPAPLLEIKRENPSNWYLNPLVDFENILIEYYKWDECALPFLWWLLRNQDLTPKEMTEEAIVESAKQVLIEIFGETHFKSLLGGNLFGFPFETPATLSETRHDVFPFFKPKSNLSQAGRLSDKSFGEPEKINMRLSKPFILLAGISGTGKTRFVFEQAKSAAQAYGLMEDENLCPVPVRPDWHEPSDLLGYVSRIGGERYVPTEFLKFLVKAWEEVFAKDGDLNSVGPNTCPFWLCLDEMNLAPVEQYFADYLSVLETRKWEDGVYSSKPLLAGNLNLVCEALDGDENSPLWKAFAEAKGIPLPSNLIVAGTVNMDETTHGFSRKVIDRALTIDFQEFFPNDFDAFFGGQKNPITLSFPVQTEVSEEQLSKEPDQSSTEFLKNINEILKGTPFELAYRALNELYLSEVSFAPKSTVEMHAVWDDYLMQKVLPRIEGDVAKLKHIQNPNVSCESLDDKEYGKGTILHALYNLLGTELLKDIWDGEMRPDLLRENADNILCRSKQKLEWMMRRLKMNHFTDFWV